MVFNNQEETGITSTPMNATKNENSTPEKTNNGMG